ncbi:MAG: hypothetical protein ACFE75_07640 [Candidatus Hodarchaeota archaeon]
MGKEKKTLGIKTTRYFTKNCTKCSFEYPNWFTNCPKCGVAWDDTEVFAKPKEAFKKTIKIVVKITEENFNKAIFSVNMIFSADQGKSWYQMNMDAKTDYYIAEIAEIPIGSVIIYYIEVFLEDGEKIIENNDGKYFIYKVGIPIGEAEEELPKQEKRAIKESLKEPPTQPKIYYKPSIEAPAQNNRVTRELVEKSTIIPQEYRVNESTIFGKPQTKIDPELKVCIHCNSKIKKMWSTCPICGRDL